MTIKSEAPTRRESEESCHRQWLFGNLDRLLQKLILRTIEFCHDEKTSTSMDLILFAFEKPVCLVPLGDIYWTLDALRVSMANGDKVQARLTFS